MMMKKTSSFDQRQELLMIAMHQEAKREEVVVLSEVWTWDTGE
jgi:hypothetical protein